MGCAGKLLFVTGCCWPEIGPLARPPKEALPT